MKASEEGGRWDLALSFLSRLGLAGLCWLEQGIGGLKVVDFVGLKLGGVVVLVILFKCF